MGSLFARCERWPATQLTTSGPKLLGMPHYRFDLALVACSAALAHIDAFKRPTGASLLLNCGVSCGISIPNEVLTWMQGEKAEQWRVLCEMAAVEKDPQKLLELSQEINRLLEENEQRLNHQHANTQSAA